MSSSISRRSAVAAAFVVTSLMAAVASSSGATIPRARFDPTATLQDGGTQAVVTGTIICDGETFLWVRVTLTQGSTTAAGAWDRHGCTHIPRPGPTPFSIVIDAPGSSTFHNGVASAVGELQTAAALHPPAKPGPAKRFTAQLDLKG